MAQPVEHHEPEFDAQTLIRAREIKTNGKRNKASIACIKKDNEARKAVVKEGINSQ